MRFVFDFEQLLNVFRDLFLNFYEGPQQLIVFGIGFFALLFFGKWLNNWIGGSQRGVIGTSIGLLLPFVSGILALGIAVLNVHNFINNPEWVVFVCIAFGIAVSMLCILFITPIFLGTTLFKTCLVFGLSVTLMIGLTFLTELGLESFHLRKVTVEKISSANRHLSKIKKVSKEIY